MGNSCSSTEIFFVERCPPAGAAFASVPGGMTLFCGCLLAIDRPQLQRLLPRPSFR
eukprot:m.44827 g.44827  ORF g.44827 m.44827 type:complete len:56 (+) comp8574_c0_seq1:3653-3820(+)